MQRTAASVYLEFFQTHLFEQAIIVTGHWSMAVFGEKKQTERDMPRNKQKFCNQDLINNYF